MLTRLAVAAGPIPSTPGGSGSEAAIQAQRNALATLAQSDRKGTALGAALAFASDWAPVRKTVIEAAAKRLGIEVAPHGFGDAATLRAVADEAGATRTRLAVRRAAARPAAPRALGPARGPGAGAAGLSVILIAT